ncbi:restin homolog isoform X2 [Bactrocera dorsalis]|uniref:Restin homolog isoform X2 n=1 Tax=Bactrocera dorsalis TaxID=27457 RepID=A0ABM3K847_BACDO|nr:restin homolog isoform X2 [Bactrocera dorsalis]
MDKPHIDTAIPPKPGSPTASHASSIASFGSGHKTHGVQKFCSKIRHKIEDNIAPRLTGKLYKSQKHSISMSSLSIGDSTSGKYTNISKQSTLPSLPPKTEQQQTGTTSAHRRLTGMLKHQRQRITKSTKTLSKREISAPIGEVATNSGIICPALLEKGGLVDSGHAQDLRTVAGSPTEGASYVDSDEEYQQLSLNLTKQSLEDEIFEELEKAAHDETKLSAVLKNFDRLIIDYNENPAVSAVPETGPRVECDVAVVEAAAAAQLELLELEPPVAFADYSGEKQSEENLVEEKVGLLEPVDENKEVKPNAKLDEAFADSIETNMGAAAVSTTPETTKQSEANTTQESKDLKHAKDIKDFTAESSVPAANNADNSLRTTSNNENSVCSSTVTAQVTEDPMTPPQPPVRPKRLEKSKSSLALPRRNVYQSPDTPTLRNIRYALATRVRSKSVWELTPTTAAAATNSKIPVFIALPLQKRSNSFCSASLTEMIGKQKLVDNKNLTALKSVVTHKSKDSTGTPTNQRRQLTKDARSASALSLSSKSRSRSLSTNRIQQPLQSTPQLPSQNQPTSGQRTKRKSLSGEKLTRSNSRLQMERTKSSIGFNSSTLGTNASPRRTPSSSSLNSSQSSGSVSRVTNGSTTTARSRDELLDKCLEKGHEILRKVESINTKVSVRKTPIATTLKSNAGKGTAAKAPTTGQTKRAATTSATAALASARTKVKTAASGSAALTGKITKDACDGTLRRTTTNKTAAAPPAVTSTKQLKYANEEKVPQPQLEFCKIIPPVLGETSDKHTELLVNVVQAKLNAPTATQQLSKQQQTAANNTREQQAFEIADAYKPTLHSSAPIEKLTDVNTSHHNNESDSDDSGHISNENDTTIHTLSTSTTSSVSLCESDIIEEEHSTFPAVSPDNNAYNSDTAAISMQTKTTKVSELLQKFEQQSQASAHMTFGKPIVRASNSNPSKVCTATRVAQLEAVQCIQTQVEFYPTYSKEILFRSGVLSELEAKRDELLSDRIIQLQAYCRGYLARKQVARRRVQELAVRCIQRNVKAFLAVRDWPWWRLLVRVTPLLNVHRTEEQLKSANEELAMLRAKLEKIENDRNELKTENQKLEAKLSEMTVDLAEERSTANIATERLEAETAERLKLEKELNEQQNKVKNLQENSEKLEMELICAKSDLNGISEDEDPENEEGGSGVYKLKYERVARELEFTKRRLQTQHEHDLEQLVGLKKQLEKKLSDAYEEVEEQRQVVGQWKRKAQKMTNEMNDLRMLLEEQNGRNNVLEKKQRKFDAECQSLQDAARQERVTKDRLSREKDVLIAEKFTLEQNLADTRLELELKEEKLASLQRELEEMTFGGSTEEEIAQLRRSKNELDRRVKEQEEELDEMAGQVQLLEQAKLRLEMSLETMRKEARREAQQRDDELEEARNNSYKKIKALECQLETEHEERTLLLREKHELERRLSSMEDQDRMDRQAEEAATQKLKRDLRKYKALLKDAQAQLERSKAETPGKALIRQLRNQLEDAESARTLVMKARQAAEAELAEVQAMFEESQKGRNDAEDRANAAHRDRAELQAQIEENEEELAELMKKYSAAVKQLNTEQIAASEYEFKLSELEADRNNLKEQVSELQQRLENVESMADPSTAMLSKRLELRTKELESRLDLEQATRTRLEVQVSRLKETLEKVQNDVAQAKAREMQAQDALKKSQKSLRDMREEYHVAASREQESVTKRKDLEKKLEQVESESSALKNDLRLALQRIADLQQAMEEDDDDVSDSEDSHSTDGSLSDLEERLRPIKVKRTTNGELMSPSSTKTLVHEKDDNSPSFFLL